MELDVANADIGDESRGKVLYDKASGVVPSEGGSVGAADALPLAQGQRRTKKIVVVASGDEDVIINVPGTDLGKRTVQDKEDTGSADLSSPLKEGLLKKYRQVGRIIEGFVAVQPQSSSSSSGNNNFDFK